MNTVSTTDVLEHFVSRLRQLRPLDNELDSLLTSVEEYHRDCESCVNTLPGIGSSRGITSEQAAHLDVLRVQTDHIRDLAIAAADSTNSPRRILAAIESGVRSQTMQMSTIVKGGYDDNGLSERGERLMQSIMSYINSLERPLK